MRCLIHYPKIYINIFLFVGLTTLGTLVILINWFIKLSVQTFQRLIQIYRLGYFVFHNWGCTSIYWPLSYLFRSLCNYDNLISWCPGGRWYKLDTQWWHHSHCSCSHQHSHFQQIINCSIIILYRKYLTSYNWLAATLLEAFKLTWVGDG